MASIEVVSAVIIRNGRVLLTQRDPMRSNFGYLWESPGGKVEVGESQTEALQREVGEELGVDSLVAPEPLGEVSFGEYHLTFLRIVRTAGHFEPRKSIGLGWFSMEEVETMPLTPGNLLFLPKMIALMNGWANS